MPNIAILELIEDVMSRKSFKDNRTKDSVRRALIYEISNRPELSGKHTNDEGFEKLYTSLEQDGGFKTAFAAVVEKILELFPVQAEDSKESSGEKP